MHGISTRIQWTGPRTSEIRKIDWRFALILFILDPRTSLQEAIDTAGSVDVLPAPSPQWQKIIAKIMETIMVDEEAEDIAKTYANMY